MTLIEAAMQTIRVFREGIGALPECVAVNPADLQPGDVTELWNQTAGRVKILVDPGCPRGKVHVGALADFCAKTAEPEDIKDRDSDPEIEDDEGGPVH